MQRWEKMSLLKFQDKNGVVIQYYNDKTKGCRGPVLRKGGRRWLEGNELDVNADIIVGQSAKKCLVAKLGDCAGGSRWFSSLFYGGGPGDSNFIGGVSRSGQEGVQPDISEKNESC
jgi:hypothetical protein